MTEKRKRGRPLFPASKQKERRDYRFPPSTLDALGRLHRIHGYGGKEAPEVSRERVAAEAAIECWEIALSRAAENIAPLFVRAEWNMMADVCNGTMWAYGTSGSRPEMLLAASIEDGHRLDGTGYRWFCDEDFPAKKEQAKVDAKVSSLLQRIRSLTYTEAWAVIQAICFFWQHTEIDHSASEWWTVSFRRGYRANGEVGLPLATG